MHCTPTCPVCGTTLSQGKEGGICPACLLRAALGEDSMRHPESSALAERIPGILTVVVLFGYFLSSCSTTTPVSVRPAPNSNWVNVHSKPPTWYPRGTPANGPVDYHAGEWIYAEDSSDNRFFIPFHGLSTERRKTLLAEAFAARNPEKLKIINREETNRRIATGVGFVIVAPILALGSCGGCY